MDAYLTYAVGEKGYLVHIDSVPNGEACGCTCPECGSKLIAKNKGQHNHVKWSIVIAIIATTFN